MIFYADLGIAVDIEGIDDVQECVDELLEALADLEEADPAIVDVDVTATLTTGDVEVNMCVEASDLAEAGQKLLATVRGALHRIGGDTPGWEKAARLMHEACMNVRSTERELSGT
ncbi:hypothetical protein [Actinomadura parmotrematis]|uniref:Uncharacterized protein n=1 Tax=Actinomadura parmotrematis TaxID=2864039 RepID=A0ABS7FW04_9ACTN|nr:hypothetical protein [Actinomadura parmotrematis]MBW8484608.1 hypothetical protein [Actinomadura parmotrematis]